MIGNGQLRQHLQALNSSDLNTRRDAIHALKEQQDWSEVPADLVKHFVESLRHQLTNGIKQTSLRQDLLIILGRFGAKADAAVPELIDLLKDGVPDGVREEAASALGKIGKKAQPAIEPLIDLMPRSRPSLAVRIILALSDIGGMDSKVKSAIVGLWQAPDLSQQSQIQVALALCRLHIDLRGLFPFLARTVVSNPDANLRRQAADGLAFANKNDLEVVPALIVCACNDKDEKIRAVAENSLNALKLPREKAVRICAKQLKDSGYAELALKKVGPVAVPALIEALASEEASVREKAARILSGFGEQAVSAVSALTKTLKDDHLEVRLAAAKALWNVTKVPDVVVPVLIELLQDKEKGAPDDTEERRRYMQTIIEALWRIGPPAKAAVPALTKKSKDKNRLISESALNALKEIAPPAVSAVR